MFRCFALYAQDDTLQIVDKTNVGFPVGFAIYYTAFGTVSPYACNSSF